MQQSHAHGPPVGETAPDLSAPSTTHQTLDLDRFVGRVPVVVVFLAGLEDPGPTVRELDALHLRFGEHRVQLLLVVDRTIGELVDLSQTSDTAVPLLADPAGRIADDYSVDVLPDEVTAVVIDAEGTVIETQRWQATGMDPVPLLERLTMT